jgi:signal transduction histidine kinase
LPKWEWQLNLKKQLKQKIEDITGLWAFHLPMFYFAAPLSILSSVLQDFDSEVPITFFPWLVASFIGFLSMILIARFAIRFRKTETGLIPLPIYFLFSFLIGGSKGLITGFIGGQLTEISKFDNALAPRAITSGFIAVLLIPAGSLYLAGLARFTSTRDSLVHEAIRIESKLLVSDNSISTLQSAAQLSPNSELAEKIKELLKDISKLSVIPSPAQWEIISNELKRIVAEDLRPLSKELWQNPKTQFESLSFRNLINMTLKQFKFPMLFVIGASLLGTAAQFLRHSENRDLNQTLIWTATIIALPYIIFKSFVILKVFSGRIAFICMVATSIFLEALRIKQNSPTTPNLSLFFNTTIFGVFLVTTLLTGGVIYVSLKSQALIIQELIEQIDQKKIKLMVSETSNEQLNRELAKFLHGHLQTRLMAMALALDLARKNSDLAKVQETIHEIELVLENPMNRFNQLQHDSIEGFLTRIQETWAGLVTINSHLEFPKELQNPQLISYVSTVIEEVVTNAVRHGSATEMEVNITGIANSEIHLHLLDNGTGLGNVKPGLGSALITSICGSQWSLVDRELANGVEFQAIINTK